MQTDTGSTELRARTRMGPMGPMGLMGQIRWSVIGPIGPISPIREQRPARVPLNPHEITPMRPLLAPGFWLLAPLLFPRLTIPEKAGWSPETDANPETLSCGQLVVAD